MKTKEHCIGCLKNLARKTLRLSGGREEDLQHFYVMIDELSGQNLTPPAIANMILRRIRGLTRSYDPYETMKAVELEEARQAFQVLKDKLPLSLTGRLMLSALGNSTDFFTERGQSTNLYDFRFAGDVEKIEDEIYIKGKDVLIIGDNITDFIFDMALVEFLRRAGKTVFYAVREHPVQNDLSMADVKRFNLDGMYDSIISTGTDEVGMRRECIKGTIKSIWEGDGVVIAKGMGNYETISEYHGERTVIHVMKIKCPAVSRVSGHEEGTYAALFSPATDSSERSGYC